MLFFWKIELQCHGFSGKFNCEIAFIQKMGRTRSKVHSDGKAFSRRAGKPKTSLGRRLYCVLPLLFCGLLFLLFGLIKCELLVLPSFIAVIFYLFIVGIISVSLVSISLTIETHQAQYTNTFKTLKMIPKNIKFFSWKLRYILYVWCKSSVLPLGMEKHHICPKIQQNYVVTSASTVYLTDDTNDILMRTVNWPFSNYK